MSSPPPYRPTNFEAVSTKKMKRNDGTILYQSTHPLETYPDRLTERLLYWAKETPQEPFLGQRANTHEGLAHLQTLTYAQTVERVQALSQALLNQQLSSVRTLAILSENSLDHALLALAAIHVGIPYAPISPPYSLMSQDFGKLRHTLNLMTPGMIYASDGYLYERGLRVAHKLFPDAILLVSQNPIVDLPCQIFADLQTTEPTSAVDEAFANVTSDTVAKVLFTSGSTNMPKGVMNTHRMWCANLQQITQSFPFLKDQPPTLVDWLPWNHTFGGNHNFGLTLYNGGTLYIDAGKPSPAGIHKTVANLREVAPTVYFNVPKGFAELIPFLRQEPALREKFYSRLEMIFYAGASLPQPVWDALEELAVETTGYRVPIITGLGMTESGPSALFTRPGGYSGLLGAPVAGMTVKLAPDDDKMEARYRAPSVTPGYWRQPEFSAACFDDEGFFHTGDAVKFVDENDPDQGLQFDGRIAENFKLVTGTWVTVGNLRLGVLREGSPIVQDVVISGHDQEYVGAIFYLNNDECKRVVGTSTVDYHAHPAVREQVQQVLNSLLSKAGGSSSQIRRAIIATIPPSIDLGEITDKGSLNQRVILRERAEWVKKLYTDPVPAEVFVAQN